MTDTNTSTAKSLSSGTAPFRGAHNTVNPKTTPAEPTTDELMDDCKHVEEAEKIIDNLSKLQLKGVVDQSDQHNIEELARNYVKNYNFEGEKAFKGPRCT